MKQGLGLVHLYCGDGKGKTTAAMGLALRAVGNQLGVVVVQFLKDGSGRELAALKQFPQVRVLANASQPAFASRRSQEEQDQCRQLQNAYFLQAVDCCTQGSCALLILDEAIGALAKGLLDKALVLDFLRNRPAGVEVVLTGRNPDEDLLALADYVSEVKKIKHPFDAGIRARQGIEF